MALAERKINQQTVVDPSVEYSRIWSFRTQEQMDLWINEMQGQISDGRWENSRYTDWLWKGYDLYMVDPDQATQLTLLGGGYGPRRTSFGMSKSDLVDYISDRVYTENGFEYDDFRSLKAAWKEIQEAIKNPREVGYSSPIYQQFVVKPREYEKARKANQKQIALNYIKENLSDLIKVEESSYTPLRTQVEGLYFDLVSDGKKVKVHNYGDINIAVPVDKVRITVDFLMQIKNGKVA